eukprot:1030393-Pleurochrysis_carterae.AAC.1
MHACFALPAYPHITVASDAFHAVRMLWDSLRDALNSAVTCSWLIVLDESMGRWMGRGMPGLMVVQRKPTPVGLELHTLCDALSGVLT